MNSSAVYTKFIVADSYSFTVGRNGNMFLEQKVMDQTISNQTNQLLATTKSIYSNG